MGRSALILLADSGSLRRLREEGGLLEDFLGEFRGGLEDTLRPVVGVDPLLSRHSVVALDERLLAAETQDSAGQRKLRDNLATKIGAHVVVRLLVLSSGQEDAAESIRSATGGHDAPGSCDNHVGAMEQILVIILDDLDLQSPIRKAIREVIDARKAVAVYLMMSKLQPAGDALVRAENVWPAWVARLLVAVHARGDDWRRLHAGDAPRLLLWRTIAWGTDGPSHRAPGDWEMAFLDRLRLILLPSRQNAPSPAEESLQDGAEGGDPKPPRVSIAWDDEPEEYAKRVDGTIGDGALRARNEAAGRLYATKFAAGMSEVFTMLDERVRAAWRDVEGRDGEQTGLPSLQLLADGRAFPRTVAAPTIHAGDQSSSVRQRLERLAELKRRRDDVVHHGTRTLAVARAKFVPLWWRGLIGGAVTLSTLALLLGALLPLRPAPRVDTQGTAFMGVPLRGKSVAFLVDRSQSMEGFRLRKLKEDLVATIQSLPDDARFTIVAFAAEPVFLPGGEAHLVSATDASRRTAEEWLTGLTAAGGTRAAEALERLVRLAPAEIVLLTDGMIEDSARVAEHVASLPSDTRIRISAISLFGDSGEAFLRDISQATSGTYAFVPFDPFEPIGFHGAILLVVAATALGALLGAILPWYLERRAGRAGANELARCVSSISADYETRIHEGGMILARSITELRIRETESTAAFHQALGKRALAVVGRLFASTGASTVSTRFASYPTPSTSGVDRLAADDKEDARRLDVPLPDPPPAGGSREDEVIQHAAQEAAKHLRRAWTEACEGLMADSGPFGHVPGAKIESCFGSQLRQTLGTWTLRLLLQRPSLTGESEYSFMDMIANVRGCVGADRTAADLLSGPIGASSSAGLSDCRKWQWIELTRRQVSRFTGTLPPRLESVYARVRGDLQSIHRGAVADSRHETDEHDGPVGIAALGLIHEEVRIELTDDSPTASSAGVIPYSIRAWTER